MTLRVHLFPSRTRQLSSLVLTILGWKRPGTISRCQHILPLANREGGHCSLAQSVERMTVNHDVVSSSLTGAAIKNPEAIASGFFLFYGSITNVGIGSNPIPTFVIEPVCVRATKIPGCDRLPWKTDVLHCRQR